MKSVKIKICIGSDVLETLSKLSKAEYNNLVSIIAYTLVIRA